MLTGGRIINLQMEGSSGSPGPNSGELASNRGLEVLGAYQRPL
jgi:hypothetical protein